MPQVLIQTDSVENQVKSAILNTYGDNDTPPTDLANDKKMSDFGFNDLQNISLSNKFTTIAQTGKDGAKVTVAEVEDCTKVQDCIDLVIKSSKSE